MTKQRVSVLMGGWSTEREVSLSSGEAVMAALQELDYKAIAVDVKQEASALLNQLLKARPHVIFNALHGVGGEDGVIQGFLEILHIPYTHSGVTASAVAMNKVLSRKIFTYEGIPTPTWKVVKVTDFKQRHPMLFPYVIKPINEGSSKGVKIISGQEDYENLWKNHEETKIYGEEILVEAYIPGREIQVAIMGDRALGAIEIRPQTGFYDYVAKYTPGKAEHLMPAPITAAAYKRVLELALKAHQVLGCRGISRVDFRYNNTQSPEEFYILEVNTQPGMTPLSLVQEVAAHCGIGFKDLIRWMVDNARCD